MASRRTHPHPSASSGAIPASPLDVLAHRLRARFPDIQTGLDAALHPDRGISVLDLLLGDQWITVAWSPQRGFGVSSRQDVGFGEGPDEVFESVEDAAQRIVGLLLSHTNTSPPAPANLAEVRQRLGFSQVALAKRMKVQQASISKLERRPDALLSTLQAYLSAMGANFQLVARTRLGSFPLRALGRARKAKVRGGR